MALAQDRKKIKKKTKKAVTEGVETVKKKLPRLAPEDQQRVDKLLFEAILAKIKGDNDKAITAFEEVIKLDAKNGAAMYELAKIYHSDQSNEEALTYAQRAADADVANKWYQELYAEILMDEGQFSEAAGVYEQIIESHPSADAYYLELAYLYIQSGEYEKAIGAYDKLEAKVGFVDEFVLQKIKLLDRLEKWDEAIEEAERLIKVNPDNANYYGLSADLYLNKGEEEKAFEIYEKVIELDPNNPQGRLMIAEYYRKKGDEERYLEEVGKIFEGENVPLALKLELLTAYAQTYNLKVDEKSRTMVLDIAKKLTKQHEDNANVHTFYGDLLYSLGDSEPAIKSYRKSTDINPDQLEVWQNILWLNYERNDFDALEKDSDEMMSVFPSQALPYYFKGIAYNELKEYEKSVKTFKRGVMISGDDKRLKMQIYTALAEAYYNMKDYEKSDKTFDKALALEPENVTLLNNYSYFLSERGARLQVAQEMSAKSNELVPNNASYQDTYGWIMYKQGNYPEAKTWLQKSLDNGGINNAVILEHFGDVLYKLQDINGAVEYWQKALENGGDKALLERKIKEKKVF